MKKIFKILSFLLILFVFSACGNQSSTEETSSNNEGSKETTETTTDSTKKVLKVGTEANFAPWIYMDGDDIAGLDYQIIEEIGNRMGYEIEWSIAGSDGLWAMLDSGQVDTVAGSIYVNPEREEKYIFSERFGYTPDRLVVHADNDEIKGMDDMYGNTFATFSSGASYNFITSWKEENDTNDEVEVMISEGRDWEQVATGKADASVYPATTFGDMVEESQLELKQVGDVLYTAEQAYPFNKNVDESLLDAFNEALISMHDDGWLSTLYMDEFGFDISEPDSFELPEG